MADLKPLPRHKLVRKLRKAGFEGPFPGGKHSYMTKSNKRIIIPNPHRGDIAVGLIKRILKQANISAKEWQKL
ncbi:type II toxin-antitoxin system HicA family toxin [candidate division KSB1 bacterium]|nr:type II toxin-antitoxin system HicA family toxin [candidate division KSB1 bacterium]NIR73066.1 type II toxin-antitoxin system HicA family toxin [candidate division KSB1 bacterium]NIS28307.1 type II toxin-antitoxin system HicA family toxin [candidate division KSB1 bacterium]NIT75176.1 type II toxin-antitoxin system HicA family toxin [candidate division KSB1 bacterium]NIU29013.1 type II toxin-antitoxin system HicA family toxin [candidate division KSB1 bacterium]